MPHATSDVQQRSAAPSPPSQCPSETFCLMQRWTDIRLSSSSLNFTYHKTPTRDLEKTTAYLASPVTTPPGAWLLLNSQIISELHAASLRVMGSAPAKSPSPPAQHLLPITCGLLTGNYGHLRAGGWLSLPAQGRGLLVRGCCARALPAASRRVVSSFKAQQSLTVSFMLALAISVC